MRTARPRRCPSTPTRPTPNAPRSLAPMIATPTVSWSTIATTAPTTPPRRSRGCGPARSAPAPASSRSYANARAGSPGRAPDPRPRATPTDLHATANTHNTPEPIAGSLRSRRRRLRGLRRRGGRRRIRRRDRFEHEHLNREIRVDVVLAHERDHLAPQMTLDNGDQILAHDLLEIVAKRDDAVRVAVLGEPALAFRERIGEQHGH